MTSTDYEEAHHQGAADKLLAPRIDGPAPKPISSNRLLGSLKEAASWRGADRNTVVTSRSSRRARAWSRSTRVPAPVVMSSFLARESQASGELPPDPPAANGSTDRELVTS